MRALTLSLVLLGLACPAAAHHPNRESQPVSPRIEVIPPLGNNLPPSYRRRYNRPRHIGGKIAYWIAPSSQEAMAWHDAQHMNAYRDHRGRIVRHYFYPKPWEALAAGSRNANDAGKSVYETEEDPEESWADEDELTFGPASKPVVVSPVPW